MDFCQITLRLIIFEITMNNNDVVQSFANISELYLFVLNFLVIKNFDPKLNEWLIVIFMN